VVEAELDRLPTMPIAGLRKRYSEAVPDRTAKSRSVRICSDEVSRTGYRREPMAVYRLRPRRLLDQLVKAAMAKPNGRLELPRRIKPGSELVRTWKRKDLSRHGDGRWLLPMTAGLLPACRRSPRKLPGNQMERSAVLLGFGQPPNREGADGK